MGRSKAIHRRCLLLGSLLLCLGSWACFFCLAVSSLAQADPEPFTPPAEHFSEPEPLGEVFGCEGESPVAGIREEGEGEVPADIRELAHIRLENQEACKAELQRLDEIVSRLWWVTDEQAESVRLLPTLESANPIPALESLLEPLPEISNKLGHLSNDGYLRASILGPEDEWPLPVAGDIETTAGTDEAVLAAVKEGTETVNQNDWGILGLVIGFGACAVIYKLVRP
jgi:hypothetical protein